MAGDSHQREWHLAHETLVLAEARPLPSVLATPVCTVSRDQGCKEPSVPRRNLHLGSANGDENCD